MTSPLQVQLETRKEKWNDSTSLGQKLSDIGYAYEAAYNNSFRLFHSNHRQAHLLRSLKDKSNEVAFQSLIAILKALPKTGALSKALIECISTQNVATLGLHAIPEQLLNAREGETQPHEKGCYYYAIRSQLRSSGSFNSCIADTLQSIGLNFTKAMPSYIKKKERNIVVYEVAHNQTLSDKLADVGYHYMKQHHHKSPWWQIFHRHTHQKQALLLRQIEGKSDEDVKTLCAEVLLSLKSGELTRAIWGILNQPQYAEIKRDIKQSLNMPARSTSMST